MRPHARSLAAAAALFLVLTACGARTTLPTGASAGSGGSGAGGGVATSTTTTGAGGGVPVFTCNHPYWAGAALEVPLGPQWPRATAPKIIAFPGQITHLVTFANANADGTIADAGLFTVFDPFGAWPPKPDVVHSLGAGKGGFVVSPDPTHTVDFATFVGSTFTVDKVAADGTIQPIVAYPSVAGPLSFIAASESAYLIGTGSASQLDLHGIVNPKQMSSLGSSGCATSGTLADGVAIGYGKFLVASSIGMSGFCGPSDPPDPPVQVQLELVDVAHEQVNVLGGFTEEGAIATLSVIPRPGGGAWIGFSSVPNDGVGAAANGAQLLFAVDDEAKPLGGGPTFNPDANDPIPPSAPVAYAFAANGGLLAQVRVVLPDALSGGQFRLMLSPDLACAGGQPTGCSEPPSAYLALASLPGVHVAASAASIAVSPDGQSVLVAFVEGNSAKNEPTMTLARVDCAALE